MEPFTGQFLLPINFKCHSLCLNQLECKITHSNFKCHPLCFFKVVLNKILISGISNTSHTVFLFFYFLLGWITNKNKIISPVLNKGSSYRSSLEFRGTIPDYQKSPILHIIIGQEKYVRLAKYSFLQTTISSAGAGA